MVPEDFGNQTALLTAVPSSDSPNSDDLQTRLDHDLLISILHNEDVVAEILAEIERTLPQMVHDLRDNKRKAKKVRKPNRPLIGKNEIRRVLLLDLVKERQLELELAGLTSLTKSYLLRTFLQEGVMFSLTHTPFQAAVTTTQIYCDYSAKHTLKLYNIVDVDRGQGKDESAVSKAMKKVRECLSARLPGKLTVSSEKPHRFVSHQPTLREIKFVKRWLYDFISYRPNQPPSKILLASEKESVDEMNRMVTFFNTAQFNGIASRAKVGNFEDKLIIPDFKRASADGPDFQEVGGTEVPEFDPARVRRAIAEQNQRLAKAFSRLSIYVDGVPRCNLDHSGNNEYRLRLEPHASIVKLVASDAQGEITLAPYILTYDGEAKTEEWKIWVNGMGWIIWLFDYSEEYVTVACRLLPVGQQDPLVEDFEKLSVASEDRENFSDWTRFPAARALWLWLNSDDNEGSCSSKDQIVQFLDELGTKSEEAREIAQCIWNEGRMVPEEDRAVIIAKAMGLPDLAVVALDNLQTGSKNMVDKKLLRRYEGRGSPDAHRKSCGIDIERRNPKMKAYVLGIDQTPASISKELEIAAGPLDYSLTLCAPAQLGIFVGMWQDIDIYGSVRDHSDATRFTDFSGSYSKALLHDALGVPNADAFNNLKHALNRADYFENVILGRSGGGPNSKNGSKYASAFDLWYFDKDAMVIPLAPSVASAQTAAEEVEHYWAALLRDVSFVDYSVNPLVAQAVADLNNLSFLRSSDVFGHPTPMTSQNLFRGYIVPGDGNLLGPYISQFMVQPTFLDAYQAVSQHYETYMPKQSFMTDVDEFNLIQNGGDSGRHLIFDPTYYHIRNGRDLCAYMHADPLYQAYFTAFLVLDGINAPPNPGNPYGCLHTEKVFAKLGRPEGYELAEVARRALKTAWFYKWTKDLRLRPEEYGGLVQARLTNSQPQPQAAATLHPDVLNSAVLPIIRNQFGSYLLPQTFPKGSPTHPGYPCGHGMVAGACVTALKFFFDGRQRIRPLLNAVDRDVAVPSSDGLLLNPYDGADRDDLTVNGELNKLAFNISVGQGIHAGSDFRSSSILSILLGEQIALRYLREEAKSCSVPFAAKITMFDGSVTTVTNQNNGNHGREGKEL